MRDVVKDVFLPWYNAYRFLMQNVERLKRVSSVCVCGELVCMCWCVCTGVSACMNACVHACVWCTYFQADWYVFVQGGRYLILCAQTGSEMHECIQLR